MIGRSAGVVNPAGKTAAPTLAPPPTPEPEHRPVVKNTESTAPAPPHRPAGKKFKVKLKPKIAAPKKAKARQLRTQTAFADPVSGIAARADQLTHRPVAVCAGIQ